MLEPRTHRRLAALTVALTAFAAAETASAQTPNAGLLTQVDPSVRPGDDFYRYANNAWLAATQAPEGLGRVDSTSLLRSESAVRVRDLIHSAAAGSLVQASPEQADLAGKIGDYYASLADGDGIDALGLTPLQGDLAAIAAISGRTDLSAWLGRTVQLDDGSNQQTESLWGLWIHQGFHDADRYAAHVVQGGLGLADPADYLDPTHSARLDAYRAYVSSVLNAIGSDDPDRRAARVVELESAIAASHASRADTDDVFKTDNAWRSQDFAARAPGIDWPAYFAAAGLPSSTPFVVWQPRSVIDGAALVASRPIDVWKDYLAFHLVMHRMDVLPTAMLEHRAAFEAALSGDPIGEPDRSQLALAATQAALADGIGRLYIERFVPQQTQAAAEDMVDPIRTAYRARLNRVAWMSPETRARALAKLETLRIGMAYARDGIDYSGLPVSRHDAYGNAVRAEAFTYRLELAKLDGPVDPDEWPRQLHPQMVGAILNISPNTMQFAAGLLQPPYFDPDGDAASNYGSAGAGLAHEVVHTFDGVSNLYDERGRLAPWWTPQDSAGFEAASARLAAQLDHCCPAPDLCVDSTQVLGESVADLAGLAAAHDAYILSLNGRPDVVKGGLTGEQRFFIAFAQRWRRQQSPESLERMVATDNHAPPHCRSNLARNADGWAEAFGVVAGDPLYLPPEDRVQVW